MAPSIRIVQAGSATAQAAGASDAVEPGNDALEPVPELFPFCGNGSSNDATDPGEWPFDRQCVLRLPEDIAKRVDECLQKEGADLDLRFKPILARRPGKPPGRHWEVKAFGEVLNGTLVDLPCHVESHLLASEETGVAYKTADISQLLIVHRGSELPGAEELLDQRTFEWGSGLTPPMQHVRRRKFRGRPHPKSEFAPEHIAEAVSALRARMNNEPYVYEECSEVSEEFYQEVLRTQPQNIWRPPVQRDTAKGSAHQAPSKAASSSGGSGGGSSAVAAMSNRKRAAGSTVSDGAGSGNTSMADSSVAARRLRVM